MRRCGILMIALVFCPAVGAAPADLDRGIKRISDEERRHVRQTVAEVLAQPEFRQAHDPSPGWGERLLEKLKNALSWLRDRLWGLPVWLGWLIVAWMVLTLIAILAHFVYVLLSQVGVGRGRRTGRRRPEYRIYGDRKEGFDAVFAEAQRQLQAGRWAAAVRYLYVAAILWLDQHGRVRFRESKTNRDYIRELAPHAGAQQRFRTLTQAFDVAVYGGHAPTEDTCRAMATTLKSLQREVGSADKA